jgi:hypothetical protein
METGSDVVVIGDPDVAAVAFTNPRDPFEDGYELVDFTVEIAAPGLSATSVVRTFETQRGLRDFFGSLAADWRGWQGTRRWESIEHDLTVEATVDHHGHVALTFILQRDYRPDAWFVTVTVSVDAGEAMTKLASRIGAFLRT